MHFTYRASHAIRLSLIWCLFALTAGGDCWHAGFTAEACCNLAWGQEGNLGCWRDGYTFAMCCPSLIDDRHITATATTTASLVPIVVFTKDGCWGGGFSEESCCSPLHGPGGDSLCWVGGYTSEKCCPSLVHGFRPDLTDGALGNAISKRLAALMFDLDYSCRFIERLVPDQEGSYVHCLDAHTHSIHDSCVVFSYGVAGDDSFDREMQARWGCEVHQFDHTVIDSQGSNSSAHIHFHIEGLGSSRKLLGTVPFTSSAQLREGMVDSLESHYERFVKRRPGLFVLKVDIDGWEYAALAHVSPSFWNHVDLLHLELHYAHVWQIAAVKLLMGLRNHFLLYHSYINPCCSFAWGPGWRQPVCVVLSFIHSGLTRSPWEIGTVVRRVDLDPSQSKTCPQWPALQAEYFLEGLGQDLEPEPQGECWTEYGPPEEACCDTFSFPNCWRVQFGLTFKNCCGGAHRRRASSASVTSATAAAAEASKASARAGRAWSH